MSYDFWKNAKTVLFLIFFFCFPCYFGDVFLLAIFEPDVDLQGGGDGTASFTLFILFAALRADDSRADEARSSVQSGRSPPVVVWELVNSYMLHGN